MAIATRVITFHMMHIFTAFNRLLKYSNTNTEPFWSSLFDYSKITKFRCAEFNFLHDSGDIFKKIKCLANSIIFGRCHIFRRKELSKKISNFSRRFQILQEDFKLSQANGIYLVSCTNLISIVKWKLLLKS